MQPTSELPDPPVNLLPTVLQAILSTEYAKMIITRLNRNALVVFTRHRDAQIQNLCKPSEVNFDG